MSNDKLTTENSFDYADPEKRRAPELGGTPGSASEKPYDPLDSLEKEVERFMRTNLFTPMEVTGFYIQARCVISELRGLRKENEYLRNVRERQTDLLRRWADWARAHGHDVGMLDDTRALLPILPNTADEPHASKTINQ